MQFLVGLLAGQLANSNRLSKNGNSSEDFANIILFMLCIVGYSALGYVTFNFINYFFAPDFMATISGFKIFVWSFLISSIFYIFTFSLLMMFSKGMDIKSKFLWSFAPHVSVALIYLLVILIGWFISFGRWLITP